MTSPVHEDLHVGSRAAAVSNAIVGLFHDYTGRGPTRARTTVREDLIVCVLGDTLTRSEHSLVAAGEVRLVLEERAAFQRLIRAEAISAVESLTGRTVTAFMGSNHIDPDLSVETFVLEPESVVAPAGAAS